MTDNISGKLINRLADVLHEIRNDWTAPDCLDALSNARNLSACTDNHALALAAVRAAGDPANHTPKVIALDGAHWRDPTPPPAVKPWDKPAYYGPTATLCTHELADDEGQPRQCRRILTPGETPGTWQPCTHGRISPERRAAIQQARAVVADAQGSIERTEGETEQRRVAAREAAA